jgi:hypothetical protein
VGTLNKSEEKKQIEDTSSTFKMWPYAWDAMYRYTEGDVFVVC